ncbi:MAG: FAD-dependent oxidoreductase [Candidatus Aenigmarchaeota archaeon]|nr:FAD-dependent oxidoreductase [Candidatus Aenigmarchaeota archaeon]
MVSFSEENIYDVIIVGGAAAALTAAIYAARRAMKTLVIAKSIGGQATMTDSIENYPGFLRIGGVPLMNKMLKQAMKSGAEVFYEEVNGVEEIQKGNVDKPLFLVKTTAGNKYKSKSVILAYGKTPRTLDVPGEGEFGAKGVSYCATCDMPLYAGKNVAVVGGGNSALEAAEYGSKICKKVYLVHRRDQFRGFESLVEEVKKRKNIEILYNSAVKEIKGDGTVHSVVIQDVVTNKTREIPVNGVFVEIGSVTKTEFVKNLVKLDQLGQIIVTNNGNAYYPGRDDIRPGVFAAGDLTQTPFKQLVVSAGEGCKAALQTYNYLSGQQATFVADWVSKKKKS